jgi:hypothetical protein
MCNAQARASGLAQFEPGIRCDIFVNEDRDSHRWHQVKSQEGRCLSCSCLHSASYCSMVHGYSLAGFADNPSQGIPDKTLVERGQVVPNGKLDEVRELVEAELVLHALAVGLYRLAR